MVPLPTAQLRMTPLPAGPRLAATIRKPPRRWRYDAIGKPLWSEATGVTELVDLGDGRTRVHFTETYHVFNPVMRALLEKRVHAFISKDNDVLMKQGVEAGLKAMRRRSRS